MENLKMHTPDLAEENFKKTRCDVPERRDGNHK